jgi:hypothetical protein
MVLSKREKFIAIATLAVLALGIGNKFIFSPAWGKLRDLGSQRADLKAKLDGADLLFKKAKKMEAKWNLIKTEFPDEATTQGRVSSVLNQWSEKWGVKLSATRPERLPGDKGLQEELFAYSSTGTMEAETSFMWEIERSELPIKIASVQLGSNDGGALMSVTLNISAVYPGTTPTNRRTNTVGTQPSEEQTL